MLMQLAEYAASCLVHGKAKWPLTGCVPMQSNENRFQEVYMAGYDDGSVRLSGATHIALSPICYLKCEVNYDFRGVIII